MKVEVEGAGPMLLNPIRSGPILLGVEVTRLDESPDFCIPGRVWDQRVSDAWNEICGERFDREILYGTGAVAGGEAEP